MIVFRKRALTLAVAMMASQLPQAGFALDGFELEEIVVTATRRAQSTEEIPYNISAVSGDSLVQKGITDFAKLARNTTGLVLVDSGGRDNSQGSGLIMRGLNADASGNGTGDGQAIAPATVSTYVDDVPVFYNLHLKDIERVEILRGPQGTLYGSGSLGGTIRYMHNKPDTEAFEGEIASRLGQTEGSSGINTDTHVMLNMPLSDSVAIRTVFGYVENQGFIEQNSLVSFDETRNVIADTSVGPADSADTPPLYHGKKDANSHQANHIRISALWDISDDTTTQLSYHHQRDSYDGRQVITPAHPAGGDDANTQALLEPMDTELNVYSWDLETDLGFATLSSTVSYYDSDSQSIGDANGIYHNAAFSYMLPSDGYGINTITKRPQFLADYDEQNTGKTIEIRLASNGEGQFDYVVGAFYLEQNYQAIQHDKLMGYWDIVDGINKTQVFNAENRPAPLETDDIYLQDIDNTFKDTALFGEVTYHISDVWQITGGFRVFEQTFEASNDIYFPEGGEFLSPIGDIRGLAPSSSEEDFSDHIFKINTSYDITPNVMAYFTWAEGFRHGGVNGFPTLDIVDSFAVAEPAEYRTYDSDMATNWEVGLKGRLFDERMRFSTALFLIEWEDVQQNIATPTLAYPAIVNGETAESMGLEIEATYLLTENLEVTVGYAYTQAELTESFDVDGDGSFEGVDGDELPGVPTNTANISINYATEVFNGMELTASLSGAYVDEIRNAINEDDQSFSVDPSHSLWDMTVSLAAENWGVTLFAENLFDEHVTYGTAGRAGLGKTVLEDWLGDTHTRPSWQHGRELTSYVNRPRTIGLDVFYNF
jgi:outer membrane receptor protein involved in Fe transport